mmetsp:Transcript_12026/g.34650  ORF Transcript_12026/g.34650 Transcript_12026/m.34650 type:complete len:214 (+) Transcript_12026:2258-2899(+)
MITDVPSSPLRSNTFPLLRLTISPVCRLIVHFCVLLPEAARAATFGKRGTAQSECTVGKPFVVPTRRQMSRCLPSIKLTKFSANARQSRVIAQPTPLPSPRTFFQALASHAAPRSMMQKGDNGESPVRRMLPECKSLCTWPSKCIRRKRLATDNICCAACTGVGATMRASLMSRKTHSQPPTSPPPSVPTPSCLPKRFKIIVAPDTVPSDTTA